MTESPGLGRLRPGRRRPHRSRRLLAGTGLVLTLTVAACSDGPTDAERAVDAVVQGMQADPTLDAYDPPVEQLECVGRSLVDALGAEQVRLLYRSSEDTPPALSADETQALAVALDECLADVRQIVVDFLAAGLSADPTSDAPLEPVQASCVAETVADTVSLSALFTASRVAPDGTQPLAALPPAVADDFAAAYIGCVDARANVLDRIGAEGATDAQIACFDDAISADQLQTYYAAAFAGTERPDFYADAAATCF